MPEKISNEAFFEKLRTLGPGDVAHHSMIFPGIYPGDRPDHDAVKDGAVWTPNGAFWDAARTAIANGARIEWLRTMPRPGEFGCDSADTAVFRRQMGAIASVGVDVRLVQFGGHAQQLIESCAGSPLATDFQAGLERGDPRKSSWSLFCKRAGRLAISYLDTMDYDNGQFLGREMHLPPGPVDPDTARWTLLWRDAYERYGEPLIPNLLQDLGELDTLANNRRP